MSLTFAILAIVTVGSAIAAMTLRNLVHCALCLTVTLVGLAAVYLHLSAEFVGFAQILVYVGAVAILILFAILLTRSGDSPPGASWFSPGWWVGLLVAGATFVCLAAAIRASLALPKAAAALPDLSVKLIGQQLLHRPDAQPDNYILPLLVLGVLLTAAMIGAVIIAMPERKEKQP